MKKFFTIVMLILFLLNVLGFYGIFLGLRFKYAQDADRDLDENRYASSELVTFKVPLSIPYTDHQDFERVTGEFDHEGEVYRLVRQKYAGDTLTIVCVKDIQAKKINQALTDYVKTFSDKPSNAKQQNLKLTPNFIKDYMTSLLSLETQASGWKKPVAYAETSQQLISINDSRIKYPPKHTPFV